MDRSDRDNVGNFAGTRTAEIFYEGIERYHCPRHIRFMKKYPEWYVGMTRVSYMDHENEVVYKVPLNREGETQNELEALHYQGTREKHLKKVPIAPCHLDHEGVLTMEMVQVDEWITQPCERLYQERYYCECKGCEEKVQSYPRWISRIDGAQVGWTKEGLLVAYDL